MARTIEQTLAELRALRLDPGGASTKALDTLRAALRTSRAGAGVVVEAAARLVGEHGLHALARDVADAFAPLLDDAAKRDPGCRGKLAIAAALHALDEWDERVFVAGLRVVQREGWDGKDDTAAPLRGLCGLAHAHFARPDALDVLARLLADPEHATRTAAARAIGDTGRADATALLRYMLLVSNEAEPEVLAAVFESLLALAREASVPFLVELLGEDDERAEAAVLALGSARVTDALEALIAWCGTASAERRRRGGYLAIALLRSDEGNAYLLEAVRTRGRVEAVAAAGALATFREDAAVRDALEAAIADVKDAAARRELAALLA